MAKLVLSMDGLVLKEITLNKERTTIGRKPHNDIQIDNLAVSGEHAVIVTILNDSFLEDLGSTNGTMVNGETIKKHFLQHNDVVELGKYKLKYLNESAGATKPPHDFEKTMVLRPDAPAPAPAPAQEAPLMPPMNLSASQAMPTLGTASGRPLSESQTLRLTTSQPVALAQAHAANPAPAAQALTPGGKGPVAAVQILSGPALGRELELTKALTTLGKTGSQVAVITKRPQGYFITHVEGDRFPLVNGKALDAQAHPLNDHDIIELAGVKMEFFFKS
ncbi:MAG TPA: FHA domain-containing protein [Burkholderiales bacterium]|nr:FHA domain-containing protein [Burkholderiales bacterium]